MGFDHVLLAPPFAPGPTGNLFLTADLRAPHEALGWPSDATALVGQIAALCRARGLGLLIDLVLDKVADQGPLCAAHPALFEAPDSLAALDPRVARGGFGAIRARWDAAGPAADLAGLWASHLRLWAEAGLAGVRILGLDAVPATSLRTLIDDVRRKTPGFRFLGWTPGLAAPRLAALRGAGLDLVFSSLPWWNFRDGWLWQETASLRELAGVAAAPEVPFGPRLAAQWHDPALLRAGCTRALGCAAMLGAAWLMPMGFEYGTSRPLPVAHGRPQDLAAIREEAPFDLGGTITAVNDARGRAAGFGDGDMRLLTGPGAEMIALLRADSADARRAGAASLALLNTHLTAPRTMRGAVLLPAAATPLAGLRDGDSAVSPLDEIEVAPAALRILEAIPALAVQRPAEAAEKAARAAAVAPRIAIEAISPRVDGGPFAARRIVGEAVTIAADLICDGHGMLAAVALWRAADETAWQEMPMRPVGNDRWQAEIPLCRLGPHEFAVEAWYDAFATFRDELAKKHAAGLALGLELEEGRHLVAQAAARSKEDLRAALDALLARLDPADADADRRRMALMDPATALLMRQADDRPFRIRSDPPHGIDAERPTAGFASWYEMFPRSMSDDPDRHGTFDDVIRHLPRIRAMGFDVLYFPPIHPIGRTNRKGRNNVVVAAEGDPGSPYAIGAEEGGHDALHPELGTLDDFRRLRDAAAAQGLELALDFAIQCAPDHPWLRAHRDWFDWRPDGSLRYAENPPKKYEDIVNVDFYAAGAVPSLWIALRDVVLFWLAEGVRLFRVDNPHTKPLPFWQWMIADVRRRDPGAVFLSEAFTRPKMMYRLAKVGFSQSYTYFTWRNTKAELQTYFAELAADPLREFFRPHLFVNTPDINPFFLQRSGRAGFLIRAALATTLSGLWGMYCGFELCEAAALPHREEYLDSEKYQIRAWDWNRPGNIVAEITRLNQIRRDNPALQTHLGLTFHAATNDMVLFYGKATADRGNVVMVAVSLDPDNVQETEVEIPLWEWGLADTDAIWAEDLMDGRGSVLRGKWHHLRLDPSARPFVIWRLAPLP
ncbi:MAG: alpha-1,4-glucan--maltose-1-phosphate maltosyltransferase [Rhodospirillales bacterium]|nr:alpha-1,4-glucan--maltose-1-phosphate maltosyltransferase [Rhodospirillales bacterium]